MQSIKYLQKKQAANRDLSVFKYSSDDYVSDDCSSDSSFMIDQVKMASLCTCGGGSTHVRSCPANVCNLHKVPPTVPGTGSELDMSESDCAPSDDDSANVSLSDKTSSLFLNLVQTSWALLNPGLLIVMMIVSMSSQTWVKSSLPLALWSAVLSPQQSGRMRLLLF